MLHEAVTGETIAAIEHHDRSLEGQFGNEEGCLLPGGVRGAQGGEGVGFELDIHGYRITPWRENKNPPAGEERGEMWATLEGEAGVGEDQP